MKKLRYLINTRWKLETLSVLVVVLGLVVSSMGSQMSGNTVYAQAFQVGPFLVPAGLSADVSCGNNARLTVTRLSSFRVRVGCAALAPTPTSAVVPTVAASPTVSATPNWVFCANENQFCNFSGTRTVRYGTSQTGGYVYRVLTGGTSCNNSTFGDPAVGYFKSCHYDSGTNAISPSPTSAQATSVPTPTTVIGGGSSGTQGSSGTNSKAYGLWTPYVNAAGVTVDTCSKADHDKWFVVGPDGRRYPTWHAPVDPATGCTYGHDHGQNPANFASWDRLRRQYAYDANNNGTIDSAELAVSGVPFGIANETLVDWTSLTGSTIAHRHEDHVGHKIHYMNAEPMERYGQFIPSENATARIATPMRCDLFGKMHMGVTTKDAFTNNLHEFISYQNCVDSNNSANNYEVGTVFLAKFGKPGEFLASCIGSPNEKRDQCGDGLVKLDYFNTSPTYPGTCSDGNRSIVDWNCVQQMALVPEGQWTFNFYEIWNTNFRLLRPNGTPVAGADGLALEVNDAIRYFDPRVADFNGKVVDLCKITGTRQMRGNPCDAWRAAGSPAWDDPRSPMTGTNRAMYYVPYVINNSGGSATYCANPFGEQATPVSGACPKGYLKQFVSTKNFNFANAYGSGSNTENSQTVQSNFWARGVHAPN